MAANPHTSSSKNTGGGMVDFAEEGDEADEVSTRTSMMSEAALRRQNWPGTAYNILAVMFGAIQIPYSMGQMGWTWGIVGLVVSAASTWYSGHLIADACLATGARSYPELGRAAFGKKGQVGVVICQWVAYFLTGVTQIAYGGATWQQTVKSLMPQSHLLCVEGWMLYLTVALAPCVMVPSFGDAAPLSLLVLLAQFFGLGIAFQQIAHHGTYVSEALCYHQFTMSSTLAALANTAFAFGGHGVFPELMREMRDPRDFPKALNVSYLVVIPFYFAFGLIGFWAFGNAAAANFAENLRHTSLVSIYNWVNSVATFPLIVVNQVALFVNVELALDILPTDVCANSVYAITENHFNNRRASAATSGVVYRPTPTALPNGGGGGGAQSSGASLSTPGEHQNDEDDLEETPYVALDGTSPHERRRRRRQGPSLAGAEDDVLGSLRDGSVVKLAPNVKIFLGQFPPVVVRAVFRLGYLFSMYLCASALIGAGLGDLTDLAGALGIAALTFYAPFILYAKLFWSRLSRLSLLWCAVNVAFGLFVSATGTYYAAKSLARADVRFFKESSCLEGSFFWGNDLWGGTPSNTSTAYKTIVVGCCDRGHTCGQ